MDASQVILVEKLHANNIILSLQVATFVPVVNHLPAMEAGRTLLASVTMSKVNLTVSIFVLREEDANIILGSVKWIQDFLSTASFILPVTLRTLAV